MAASGGVILSPSLSNAPIDELTHPEMLLGQQKRYVAAAPLRPHHTDNNFSKNVRYFLSATRRSSVETPSPLPH